MNLYEKMQIISQNDKNYPAKLLELKTHPSKLYAAGNIELLNEFSLAIVGARKCEEESFNFALEISQKFGERGIVVISGLAVGIDTAAHEGTLNKKGKTIAVLGSGFNEIYPKGNALLCEKIIENNGLIISEYEPDMAPLKANFIQRNRIIAALACGVIVVEASEKSGSISTAKAAIKLKKQLFAVPGDRYNENFTGNNKLLVRGAKAILEYEDVIKEYENIQLPKMKKTKAKCMVVPNEYLDIFECIKKKPKTASQISIELSIPIQIINSKLTFMEIERLR